MRKQILTLVCLAAIGVGSSIALSGQAAEPGGQTSVVRQFSAAPGPGSTGVTAAQIARVQERVARAAAAVDRLAGQAAAEGRGPDWRRTMIESILSGPPQALDGAAAARSLAELEQASAAASLDGISAFGSTTEDLVYKPIAPCRFIDTRNVGGAINGTRGFDVSLNGSSYGGVAACNPTSLFGVNENAFGALAINVTVVSPGDAPGFLAVKPTAASPTTSLLNWYQSGASVQVANAGLVTLDQSGAADEFVVQTSGSAQVIVDVFGAFIAPNATALDIFTTAETLVNVAAGGTANSTAPACPTGYSYVSTQCESSTWQMPFVFFSGGVCSAQNNSGSTAVLRASRVCARVPGR